MENKTFSPNAPSASQSAVNISSLTIVKVVAVLLVLWFLYLIRDIIFILFVSLILVAAIDPWIDYLRRKKIPRGVGIIITYLAFFALVGLIIGLLIPPITEQVRQLSADLPAYMEKLFQSVSGWRESAIADNIRRSFQNIETGLGIAAGGVMSTLSSIFGGIVSFFLVLVMVFYMGVEENAVKRILRSFAPAKYQPYLTQLIRRMQYKIGLWLRGQLILMVIIGFLSFIGLSILGVKYALVLALIAGLLEIVPYFGPTLAAIPAIFLGFTQSPITALWILILYILIQQLESHFITPKIMQKAVGLNPIVSIVALLIGGKMAGIAGALLAIPVATALTVLIKDFFGETAGEAETIEEKAE